MKIKTSKYFSIFVFLLLLAACSTKKDRFVNRKFQAMNTKYNVMYNGDMALDKGIEDLKLKYKDNYWEILPIERMQIAAADILPGQTKNANFDRAEEKATKAIQKRSMNIDGKEKNPQMDEAHLLLGKARYYDQRYVPALEAFNYILYKYPESDKIYEAKIWRERTNMRMENDALAVRNLRKLLSEIKLKDQIYADANATLAQAFLNIEEKDSAVVRLKVAAEFTKQDEEKARYLFILGQILESTGAQQQANEAYQSVIDMKRKSPRRYVLQAHNKLAQQFDYENSDTLAFLENYDKLLKDRENRPYLDILNHQMGLFYDRQNKNTQAVAYYNKSLRSKSDDQYLIASNYRNLADIHFDTARYQTAGMYYDSTLVRLQARTREHKYISKKRENLADVIKYEAIAQHNDSILNIVALSPAERRSFYEDYIERLKKDDLAKAALAKAAEKRLAAQGDNIGDGMADTGRSAGPPAALPMPAGKKPSDMKAGIAGPQVAGGDKGSFYFYNAASAAYGKLEFKKRWGGRTLKDNWRLSAYKDQAQDNDREQQEDTEALADVKQKETVVKYTADFYLGQLPSSAKVLDSLSKERNFAYYQLGIIYKEKFKEYKLAADKLEQLLKNQPEERLVLPAMYNLYKIYEITDPVKAAAMKSTILFQFPESRYAQILANPGSAAALQSQSPEAAYETLFRQYGNGDYINVLHALEIAIAQYTGDEIVPKMELLKAHTIGKLKGLIAYKTALNFVALNYPSSAEGKEAEVILAHNVPRLERLQLNSEEAKSWKVLFEISNVASPRHQQLQDLLKKFISGRTSEQLTLSVDVYTMTQNFIVMHGIRSEEHANDLTTILKDYKDYKIAETPIVISSENYKVVQIHKNLAEYLLDPKKAPLPMPDLPPIQQKNTIKPPQPQAVPPGKGKQKKGLEPNTDDPLPGQSAKNPGTDPDKDATQPLPLQGNPQKGKDAEVPPKPKKP